MALKFFLNNKVISDDIVIDDCNYYIKKNHSIVLYLNFYGVETVKTLKAVLGYPTDSKFGITGFTRLATEVSNNCLITIKNINEYIEVKQLFVLNYVYLFKYNNEWYVARKGGGVTLKKDLVDHSKKTFDKDCVIISLHKQYSLYGEDNTKYVHFNHTVKTGYKNVELYVTNQIIKSLDIDKYGTTMCVRELTNYYEASNGLYFHKSLDGVSPVSFVHLFTKDELRKIKSGEHIDNCGKKSRLLLDGQDLSQTFYYRLGVGQGMAKLNNTSKKYSLNCNGSATCMDFIKEDGKEDYFVSQFYTELFGYTKEDVFKWYNHILELFKDVYTEEDMKLEFVEIEKEGSSFDRRTGLNVYYWHVTLSDKVLKYHKYLFAILFRYCYSSSQYTFPIKIMDLVEGGTNMWSAIKTVLNSGIKETNWDISDNNKINTDLSFESYLEKLKNYNKEERTFTSLSL